MSTRHNYTNPAFCQQSEFYPTSSQNETEQQRNHANKLSQLRLDTSLISVNGGLNDGTTISSVGVRRIQRSVSTRSFNTTTPSRKVNAINRSQIHLNNSTPPKPGPKPTNLNRTINNTNTFESTTRSGSGRYALVPVEALPNNNNINRYAIVPNSSVHQIQNKNITSITEQPSVVKRNGSYRYTKSQENIDRYAHIPIKDEPESFNEESDTFTSLPPMTITEEQPRLKSAFSSDFGSKSFVLVDHKNNQKYAMVPTADDEDLVDDNHEIIQMHHGRLHRYAVIPTEEEDDEEEEEEETCLSNSDLNQTYPNSQETIALQPLQSSTPQKNPFRQQSVQRTAQLTPLQQTNENYPTTPIKNPDATRRLHELLSTPRKTPKPTSNLTPNNMNKSDIERNSKRYSSHSRIYVHGSRLNINHIRENELNPQKLVYEQAYQQANQIKPVEQQQQYKTNKQNQKTKGNESRTTAIITPRVANYSNNTDNEDEDSCTKTSWNTSYPQKVANATATLGVISLMLTLGSIMNTGLCLYLIANNGRTFYLEFALAAGFAGIGLGILGFRTRHCEWLPNRSYISGYILVTVFCLLKCCGLLVLLALDPFPGIPLHDVTTGIVLGLSTFEVFFIGLGVLGSWWCHRPPPDNRVNVY